MKVRSVLRGSGVTLFLLSLGLTSPALGQGKGHGGFLPTPIQIDSTGTAASTPSTVGLNPKNVIDSSTGKPAVSTDYSCFLPPLSSLLGTTVGVLDLQAPAKSHDEYQSGCEAVRKKKWDNAERHLRNAIRQYEKYPAALVLLGQVMEAQQKPAEARDACSKPLTADAKYLPAYLCLSDISVRQRNWPDALNFTARALELDSTSAIAYVYNATANLNLRHLVEAEKSATKALLIDINNSEPRVHFLLAQIYAAKGDRPNTTAQLREYLKYAKDPEDVAMVKATLAKIEVPSTQ